MESKKEIKFSLIYRDMWQSSGKFQPRADQLAQIAPLIIEMGCFARVETNGGAFEQVCLLAGNNPNEAVRAFTKAFNEAGIQTHMLDRGLNALRMYPVPADVRRLMYKVKKAQGTDITRIFDGLNDERNIIPSIKYALEAGMIPQATLCITYSPVHTVEYYTALADKLIAAGAPEICLKDMAGIGRPAFLGRLVKEIKAKHPDVIIEYHGHSGPGFSVASMLEVCENGADIIDVAMEPISWGKIHPDVITIQQMLRDAGFKVADINMSAYMKARALTQSFIDEWLGYFQDSTNKHTSSLLVGCGLPGGMMGSMMADLKGVHAGINMYLRQNNQPELSVDDLLVRLFEEVEYVWPRLGYPPLVTPFSQYVKNVALMNVYNMIRGEGRWQAIDQNIWGMILGKSGRLPGKLDPEIIALAKEKGYEFTDEDPQTNYPDALDEYRKEMDENGWDYGRDDEELFELAMHDRQYRDYRSGVAKERFENDLAKAKADALAKKGYNDEDVKKAMRAGAHPICATANGFLRWEVDPAGSMAPNPGTRFLTNQPICIIETSVGYIEEMRSNFTGKLIEVCVPQGAVVKKGQEIAYIKPDDKEETYREVAPKFKRVEEMATPRKRVAAPPKHY
ncbi:Methylmalonyl-CoA carboxyltransferase 5S subunit [Porphyromonas crevioricanis]|uniref:Methylmalonyl-CoA carboxyltransferase 5S subunit n=1 Tax=Porphyromonas crevioricanis TaxID=393921 RepID=A0A2X4PNJ2_9PORP|nr:pyruvate carboxyltransferase [Porphyromonas crevioricanis]GAD08307.1 pyruvate carboxyl transferase [Porphyromonas crevioricanis JCM 13913]SQH73905.1 Methylmalonyl-CoA carboxyltransferase 5S subunit [Porphyromonas crevioricanis]